MRLTQPTLWEGTMLPAWLPGASPFFGRARSRRQRSERSPGQVRYRNRSV